MVSSFQIQFSLTCIMILPLLTSSHTIGKKVWGFCSVLFVLFCVFFLIIVFFCSLQQNTYQRNSGGTRGHLTIKPFLDLLMTSSCGLAISSGKRAELPLGNSVHTPVSYCYRILVLAKSSRSLQQHPIDGPVLNSFSIRLNTRHPCLLVNRDTRSRTPVSLVFSSSTPD